MVQAFQHNTIDAFKNYYRSIDILLIDDLTGCGVDKINAFKSYNSQFEFFFGVPSRCLVKAKVLFINILFGENEQDHLCHFDV